MRDGQHPKKGVKMLTFPADEDTRVVEEQVPEGVALRVEARLLAQTGGLEPRELHKRLQRRLTPRHRDRRARHCGGKRGQ